jgi:uncharacterized protein YbbK (DUF523 family)
MTRLIESRFTFRLRFTQGASVRPRTVVNRWVRRRKETSGQGMNRETLLRVVQRLADAVTATADTRPRFLSEAASLIGEPWRSPAHVLVSACLLGHPVSYRGTSARLPVLHGVHSLVAISDAAPNLLKLVPFCPEQVLGVPRPAVRIERGTLKREVLTKDGFSVTDKLRTNWETHFAVDLHGRLMFCVPGAVPVPLNGFVGKTKSPSCALLTARLYPNSASSVRVVQATPNDRSEYSLTSGQFAAFLQDLEATTVPSAKGLQIPKVEDKQLRRGLPTSTADNIGQLDVRDFLCDCFVHHVSHDG